MADSLELVPTLSDVGRQPEIEMAACKPEVVITPERNEISARFQRILDILLAAIAISGCWPTSENVGTSSIESGMAENVGAAVEISMLTYSLPEIPKYTGNCHLESLGPLGFPWKSGVEFARSSLQTQHQIRIE